MSVTTLDARTALVVIDLQKGLLAFPVVDPLDAVAEGTNREIIALLDRQGA